jgi:hypothetical protein
MSVYVRFGLKSFSNQLAYRSEVWLRLLGNLVTIFIQLAIWKAVIGNGQVAGITLEQMIAYSILNTLTFSLLLNSGVTGKVEGNRHRAYQAAILSALSARRWTRQFPVSASVYGHSILSDRLAAIRHAAARIGRTYGRIRHCAANRVAYLLPAWLPDCVNRLLVSYAVRANVDAGRLFDYFCRRLYADLVFSCGVGQGGGDAPVSIYGIYPGLVVFGAHRQGRHRVRAADRSRLGRCAMADRGAAVAARHQTACYPRGIRKGVPVHEFIAFWQAAALAR